MVAGLIHDIPTVAELIDRIMAMPAADQLRLMGLLGLGASRRRRWLRA